ncbi:MAG: prepilin-type N-terminal cleavage/methylation domain-containing protein [Gemmatimonadaceae bacterium]
MRLRRPGFTFIEILLAMAVFGILSSIALPKYRMMKEKAYKATLQANLGEMRVAQESYWAENQSYTTDVAVLDWRPTSDVSIVLSAADPISGFQARARHALMADTECSTAMGNETTLGVAAGDIICGPATADPPVASPLAN